MDDLGATTAEAGVGCLCSVLLNDSREDERDAPGFVDPMCPLHGSAAADGPDSPSPS